MSRRYAHFVGSMPQFESPEAAFAWQSSELHGRVRRLCGGETGPRLMWFVPLVKDLKRLPQMRTVQDGDWSSYDDTDRLAVRRGTRFTAADIPLRLARYAREELAALDAMGAPATAALPLQIGVPGYLDMALFIFGPTGVMRHARTFLQAVAHQITEVRAEAGDRVVFQLEVPAALIAVASAPPALRPGLAAFMAHLVCRQVARAPEGSRFGVHLCLGDLGHRALRQTKSMGPVVDLANALVRRWPPDRSLEFIHLPMSGGDQPPTTDPSYYRALRDLRIGTDVQVVAGIAHEAQDETNQAAVRTLVEQAAGRRVDIATSCGLGRRTPEQAEQAVARMCALL